MGTQASTVLVFAHIPKTAGSAFLKLAKSELGHGSIFHTNDRDELKRAKTTGALAGKALIAGHFFIHDLKEIFAGEDVRYATFLRDPAERLISDYYQVQSHAESWAVENAPSFIQVIRSLSLKDYLASDDFDVRYYRENLIGQYLFHRADAGRAKTKALHDRFLDKEFLDADSHDSFAAGLMAFDFIGLSEDFNRSVREIFKACWDIDLSNKALAAHAHVNGKYNKENFDTAVFNVTPPLAAKIDSDDCKNIAASVRLDTAIYNYVAQQRGRLDLVCNGLPLCAAALEIDSNPAFAQKVATALENRFFRVEDALIEALRRSSTHSLPSTIAHSSLPGVVRPVTIRGVNGDEIQITLQQHNADDGWHVWVNGDTGGDFVVQRYREGARQDQLVLGDRGYLVLGGDRRPAEGYEGNGSVTLPQDAGLRAGNSAKAWGAITFHDNAWTLTRGFNITVFEAQENADEVRITWEHPLADDNYSVLANAVGSIDCHIRVANRDRNAVELRIRRLDGLDEPLQNLAISIVAFSY